MHETSNNLIHRGIVRRIVLAFVLLVLAGVLFGPARTRPVMNRFDRVTGLGNPVMYLVWAEPPPAQADEVFVRGESKFYPGAFAVFATMWLAALLVAIWILRRIEYGYYT